MRALKRTICPVAYFTESVICGVVEISTYINKLVSTSSGQLRILGLKALRRNEVPDHNVLPGLDFRTAKIKQLDSGSKFS